MELFRPDRPVEEQKEDRFQRYAFAKRIADIASNGKYPKSLVVGIYGKWGEGKSSVLNFIEKEIGENAVVIRFNPWLFTDQNQLLKSFFETIASALGQRLTTKKERALKVFEEYADSLGTLADFIPGPFKQVFSIGKAVSKKFLDNSTQHFKQRVDDLIVSADTNFIVLIDDIDRLDIAEIQAVFKLVKLAGDFPRTAYVLSFDDDMVAQALSPKYAGSEKAAGYNFLEKIIQVPLQLPKANRETLRAYTLDLLNNVFKQLDIPINEEELSSFESNFDDAFLPVLSNPRLGVRFANAVGFSVPLLAGEVNTSDLLTIECIKVMYPELYHFIRSHPEYFTRTFSPIDKGKPHYFAEREGLQSAIREQLNRIHPELRTGVLKMLLKLFYPLQEILGNEDIPSSAADVWYANKLICSPNYFERYFSYVVREGDISDVYFKSLITIEDPEELYYKLSFELVKIDAVTFNYKLHAYAGQLTEQNSINIAKTLVRFNEYFTATAQDIFFPPRTESMKNIIELLNNVEIEKRTQACLEILGQQIEFTYFFDLAFRIIEENMEETFADDFIRRGDIGFIAQLIIKRSLDYFRTKNMFEELKEKAAIKFLNLLKNYGDLEIRQSFIASQLLKPKSVVSFIKLFTTTEKTENEDQPNIISFRLSDYENLASFINPGLLYKITIDTIGRKQYDHKKSRLNISDDALVGLFQKMVEDDILERS